jgi:ABC-2 type transport system permease protein
MFKGTGAVFRRELAAYFATPLATVFIVIFLFAMGAFTFYLGGFYDSGQASLQIFFSFHPWLYLFLIPAIAMRLWAEEHKSGTIELLLTLPIPLSAAVTGKFLAAWAFAGIALALTFPMWLTVNFLGNPDNGVILASYLGSWLMAGGYLAIGSAVSAGTSNQVIAFVVSVVISFLFTVAGAPLVINALSAILPLAILDTISSFSFLTHFNAIMAGVIDLRDIVFFGTMTVFFLYVTAVLVDLRKAG